jgi:polar amino acid transport system substrate-binding protein
LGQLAVAKIRFILLAVIIFGALGLFVPPSLARAQTPAPAAPKPLDVLTLPIEPFVMKEGDTYTGFTVDLWDALAKRLGIDYDWVEVSSADEMLQRVQAGTADLIVGKIIITSDRERLMDFSVPYFVAGLQIMVGEPHRSFVRNLLTTIIRPELLEVLALGLLVLLIMAHIIWLMERGSNENIPKAYIPGVWESMWYALSTVATLEYGDKEKPRSPLKRIIAMVLVVLGIILIAQFTAAITASMTVQQLGPAITGPGDLPGKKVATISNTVAASFLTEQGITYEGVDTVDEAASLLLKGEVDAVVFDAPVLQYYAMHNGNGRMKVVGPVFKTVFYGIAVPSGSPLRKPINETLLSLLEDGTYEQIYQKWFGTVK